MINYFCLMNCYVIQFVQIELFMQAGALYPWNKLTNSCKEMTL